MVAMEKLEWTTVRDQAMKANRRFQFQLTHHGRSVMLAKSDPEGLLLRHVTFIMDNFEDMDDETVWRDCRLFDENSVIHVVIPKVAVKEDGTSVSNIVSPTRKSRRATSASPHPIRGTLSQDSRNGAKSPRRAEDSEYNYSEVSG
jgi:hypothetical protein